MKSARLTLKVCNIKCLPMAGCKDMSIREFKFEASNQFLTSNLADCYVFYMASE